MLEIVLLWAMGKKVAAIANAKGRSGTPYVFLLLGLWFGGEIGGAILGIVISIVAHPHEEPSIGLAYVLGLLGAAVGAILTFVIVNSLAPIERYDDDYDYGDYDIRKR